LRQDQLVPLLDELIKGNEVIAPTSALGYGIINSGSEVVLGDEPPRQSPKEYFFPQREVLLHYIKNGHVETETPSLSSTPRVLLTRPCDAASLPILDPLFSWDSYDALFLQRRANTTVISIACAQPTEACFCTSVGGSPAGTEGADLLLSPVDGVYHVKIITERGKELVEKHSRFFQESSDAVDERQVEAAEEWATRITRSVDVEKAFESLRFDSPLWEDAAQQCIDCGVCTFLCPTCHCFDIRDEGDPDKGSRVRIWDSCAFSEYTTMPAHQPRPQHYRRYRQRIMHKFQYYRQNLGKTLCVGCGRCIRRCPVGVDITQVLQAVVE
jgi:sulfhydrogenase subunit beta (sulfur reductase)